MGDFQQHHPSKKRTYFHIMIIWIIAGFFALPIAFLYEFNLKHIRVGIGCQYEYKSFETHLKSKQFGRHIKYFKTITSTNNEAKKHLDKNGQHGYVIITKNQTNGRGRRNTLQAVRKG